MSKNEEQLSFSQDLQLSVRKSVSGFSVNNIDWERLKKMIMGFSTSSSTWENVGWAGLSAGLSILLTWYSLGNNPTYKYSNFLLIVSGMTFTAGVFALIFAFSRRKDLANSKKQIFDEMELMQVSVPVSTESIVPTTTSSLRVIKATYGVQDHNKDVTAELNSSMVDNKLDIMATNAIAGDPAPGTPKFLEIEYESDNVRYTRKFNESSQVTLP